MGESSAAKLLPWNDKTREDVLDTRALGYVYDFGHIAVPALSLESRIVFGLILAGVAFSTLRRWGTRGRA